MTKKSWICKLGILFIINLLLFTLIACSTAPSQPNQNSQDVKETVQPAAAQQFVGSVNSNKYHYPDCRWAQKIKPENEIWFSSAEDARNQGYEPCKTCRPPS